MIYVCVNASAYSSSWSDGAINQQESGRAPGALYELGAAPKYPHQGSIAFLLGALCVFDPRYEFQACNTNIAPHMAFNTNAQREVVLKVGSS